MRARVVALCALLCLALLVPTVAASHNMGHRYLVHGRILDVAGMPVQNGRVEIRLYLNDDFISSIISTTNCLGDFDSWRGQVGVRTMKSGDGVGEVESVTTHQPPYVNFHFHDPHLSDRHHFEFNVSGEKFEAPFSSKNRQTSVLHQLGASGSPACGSYDEFNSTFEVRTFIATQAEMSWSAEHPLVPRQVDVNYEGATDATSSAKTDFMYTNVAVLGNVTPAAGDKVTVVMDEAGTKTFNVDGDDMKFRRIDNINVVGLDVGSSFAGLRNFGIFLLVVAAIVGLWVLGSKAYGRFQEKRLRETSTRRRFRKGEQQP